MKVEVLGTLTKRNITPFQKIVALALAVALIAMMVTPAFATDEAITNGGFESGVFRWNTYTDGFGTYDDWHMSTADAYSGNGGIHVPNSQPLGCVIVQNLTIPVLADNIVNFTVWMKGGIGDGTLWAGLVFNETGWVDNIVILPVVGIAEWTQYFVDDFSTYSGEKVTAVTVSGYGGDGAGEDVYFDVVSLEVTEGSGAEFVDWTSSDTTEQLLDNFMSFMVPLIVILLPAFLLCFIAKRIDKWLIIIGVAIGAGLGHYMMPAYVPLWLVFLVVIGLIGMAYQSVRGGGAE